jgi:alkylated DNA repair protein (DNA oxidative demethylase)
MAQRSAIYPLGADAGLRLYKTYLSQDAQCALIEDIRGCLRQAPLFQPAMPRWGTPLSVKMSNCGSLGWVADKSGYRYQTVHPDTQEPWPDIPQKLLNIWDDIAEWDQTPEACLINWYNSSAKMGLHQDKDESALSAPVVSISLGQPCQFIIAGLSKTDAKTKLLLESGDVLILRGKSRYYYHGVEKILSRSCFPLHANGRVNLTLRRVNS